MDPAPRGLFDVGGPLCYKTPSSPGREAVSASKCCFLRHGQHWRMKTSVFSLHKREDQYGPCKHSLCKECFEQPVNQIQTGVIIF